MKIFFLFTDFYFKLFLPCNPKRSYFLYVLYFVLLKHNPEFCENGKKNTGTVAFRFRQVLLYLEYQCCSYMFRRCMSAIFREPNGS
jgi:hypothetical protein